MKTTVITHIYNEEYLLPFWLNHHKSTFDHGVVIDYRSNDNSVNIIKSICPTWEIITTRNLDFGAINVDLEVMDIESKIIGIKIVLNITEFLFSVNKIQSYFTNDTISYAINITTPYSLNEYFPTNNDELFKNILNDDIKCHNDRGVRQLHNFTNGSYTVGRHGTNNHPVYDNNEMHIIWLGFYPLNDLLLKRKLQIQNNMPDTDKLCGFGFQHLYDMNKMLLVNTEKSKTGKPLIEINPVLYNLLLVYNK